MTAAGELVLVRQERIPARLHQWEFPAGQVDEEDSTDEATVRATVVRELQEETGYALAEGVELVNLGVSFSSPGFTDEHCHMYLAKGVVPSQAGTKYDEGEGITDCQAFGQEEFRRMVAEGELNDAHTLSLYARLCARGFARVIDGAGAGDRNLSTDYADFRRLGNGARPPPQVIPPFF